MTAVARTRAAWTAASKHWRRWRAAKLLRRLERLLEMSTLGTCLGELGTNQFELAVGILQLRCASRVAHLLLDTPVKGGLHFGRAGLERDAGSRARVRHLHLVRNLLCFECVTRLTLLGVGVLINDREHRV